MEINVKNLLSEFRCMDPSADLTRSLAISSHQIAAAESPRQPSLRLVNPDMSQHHIARFVNDFLSSATR